MLKTKILLIDDTKADAILYRNAIVDAYEDVEVTVMTKTPPDLNKAFEYDAVILDENMGDEHGLDIAKELHGMGWLTLPVMILTGAPEGSLDHAYAWADKVAYKSNQSSFLYKVHALLRCVERIRRNREIE